jgi:hypothetical protein
MWAVVEESLVLPPASQLTATPNVQLPHHIDSSHDGEKSVMEIQTS